MDRLARQKVANDARLKNTLEQKQQVTQTLAQVEQARAQAEAQSLELKTDLNKLDKELKETQDLVVFCAQVHASITQTAASSSSSSSSSSSASASSSSSSPSSSSSASALGPMNELQGSPLSHLEQSVIEQLALAASKKRKHSE
jgi:phage shock protein A